MGAGSKRLSAQVLPGEVHIAGPARGIVVRDGQV
jgi:hypothetical protein